MKQFFTSPAGIIISLLALAGIVWAIVSYSRNKNGNSASRRPCDYWWAALNPNCKSFWAREASGQNPLPTTCSGLQNLLTQLQQQYNSSCTPSMGGSSGVIITIPSTSTPQCVSIQNQINEVKSKMSDMNCGQYETVRVVPHTVRPTVVTGGVPGGVGGGRPGRG